MPKPQSPRWMPEFGRFERLSPGALECEHTAPGSTTEAIDCWEPAVVRLVDAKGVTKGVYCERHLPRMLQASDRGHRLESIEDHFITRREG